MWRSVAPILIICALGGLWHGWKQPSKLEIKPDELGRVQLYATTWCGYCQAARQYFQAKGIQYVEYDVEKDAEANRRAVGYAGPGVPVIVVGQDVMHGFSVEEFEERFASRAQ
ncbi:glutaredoxin [Chitinivorax tropicus]|uniref:Glutaredoxin n=1 Tax=Chitinivorax tropicus TaxID=714531 RepID=A0A840MEP4_9PROT|nr:glutaredoxin domain-containing protein [Chitinivorax tropicus]MBB5017734.1 glutaredoxin [Chitinivorax tropicus]